MEQPKRTITSLSIPKQILAKARQRAYELELSLSRLMTILLDDEIKNRRIVKCSVPHTITV